MDGTAGQGRGVWGELRTLSPQAVRHRVAAVPRDRELRDRDAGDRHLQAALLPDADRYSLALGTALLGLARAVTEFSLPDLLSLWLQGSNSWFLPTQGRQG